MANGEILDDIDAQLHLPEPVIQRIQFFLARKEAASTVVLSKSWYNAWLTRPLLNFDERDFPTDVQFLDYAMTSMERYHRLNLNIESFTLWMNVRDINSSSSATELIVKALKMGAVDFNLEFNPPFPDYILPKELFASESLVGLSVVGGRICRVDVMCSELKSLSLYKLRIGDAIIRRMILNCPLLETLFLSDCDGFDEVKVGRLFNLKNLSVIRVAKTPTSWRIPLIEFEEQGVVDQPYVYGFCRLSSLLLERVEIDKMLFCDFSSKFPCVKDLTVRYCDGCEKFDISSHSINYISLAHVKRLEIQLDVPNIRKFKFSGATKIPSLCVVSASREWESDITLSCWRNIRFWWFLGLNEFLSKLSMSKITLGIELVMITDIEHLPNIRAHCKPVVENLTLGVASSISDCDALLDSICWSFRPKIVTLCLFPTNECEKSRNELLLFLSQKFVNFHEKIENGLEEVNAEIFEDMHKDWRPLPWGILFDALVRFEKEAQIRFQLKWRQC